MLGRPLALAGLLSLSATLQALPSLQLGEGTGDWVYDNSDQTWVVGDDAFSVNAYANDYGTGANGSYAWGDGAADQTAYIVFAGVPAIDPGADAFDISVSGDGGALTLVATGFGSPPLEDSNSLAPHGIYDTYFEIYEFVFDGPVTTIGNVQPGDAGTGDGYVESISVTVNSLFAGVGGIHMDLFTVGDDGIYSAGGNPDKFMVEAFAPFSHDAEYTPSTSVPEPSSLALLVIGVLGLVQARRKQAASV